MRQVILDTETTGLDPMQGHRIVEIGCLEIVNFLPTGKVYQTYINPERDVPLEASRISGITTDFLKPYPFFHEIVDDFLSFIADSQLVIHNASFDMKFINHELTRVNKTTIPMTRTIDTLTMARKKYPGSPASLDALCRRYNIDLSGRTKHGALLDSELLAQVYLELMGGRQISMGLETQATKAAEIKKAIVIDRPYREPRVFPISDEEKAAHSALIGTITNPVWA